MNLKKMAKMEEKTFQKFFREIDFGHFWNVHF